MSESRGAIRVIIEAVDRATAPVRKLGAGIRSMLRGLDLEKVKDQLGRVVRGFTDVARAATAMASKVVAGGLAAAGALAAITRSVANATAEQTRAARAANVSLQAYQELGHAAALVGSNSDQMGAALQSLQDKALDAARGNTELRRAFRLMGVTLRDSRGQMRPTADLFNDVARAFARVPPSARRTEAAVRIFGDAAIDLLPLLDQGEAGLRRAAEEARRLGIIMSDADRDGLQAFNRSMTRVSGSITGVKNAIATRLAPIITPLLDQFADWIAANRELIATKVEEYIRAIPAVIASVRAEATQLWERIGPLVNVIVDWVKWLGPLEVALGLIALKLGAGGLIVSVIKLGGVLATVLLPPLLTVAATLGRIALFRLPAAVAGLLGLGAGGAAAAGATAAAGAAAGAGASAAAGAGAATAGAGAAGAAGAVGSAGMVAMLSRFLGGLGLAVGAAQAITAAEDPERRRENTREYGRRVRERGQNSGPGGETAAEIERRLYGDTPNGPGAPSGPPVPRANVQPQRVDAGGTIRVQILQDGTVGRVEARPNDPRIRFDATTGTGRYMEAPG